MGREKKWVMMAEKKIYSTAEEWAHAKVIMQNRINSGESPPFKIKKDKDLSHSFLVGKGEDGKPMLGVIANSHGNEGILGFGAFGVCKLVLWQDGQKNAIKIESDDPANNDQYEIEIMKKLGLIRMLFKRSWEERVKDLSIPNEEFQDIPHEEWIKKSSVRGKTYKVIPLIDGVNLENYLSSIPSVQSMASQRLVAISIAKELMQLHKQGIYHNDLHAGNVMLDAHLDAFLIDFGKSVDVARKPTSIKELHNRFGRMNTLAPELIAFSKMLDEEVKKDKKRRSKKNMTHRFQRPPMCMP